MEVKTVILNSEETINKEFFHFNLTNWINVQLSKHLQTSLSQLLGKNITHLYFYKGMFNNCSEGWLICTDLNFKKSNQIGTYQYKDLVLAHSLNEFPQRYELKEDIYSFFKKLERNLDFYNTLVTTFCNKDGSCKIYEDILIWNPESKNYEETETTVTFLINDYGYNQDKDYYISECYDDLGRKCDCVLESNDYGSSERSICAISETINSIEHDGIGYNLSRELSIV